MTHPRTVQDLRGLKSERPQVWITAYDFFQAALAQSTAMDAILVGDSLGMTMLGYANTLPVTLDDMIYHARVVRRGAPDTAMIVDLPFLTYATVDACVSNAGRIMQASQADAVKIEGGERLAESVAKLVAEGIPVIGHLGLTPQSVHTMGGYRVQARTETAIETLLQDAASLQDAGISALVLEGIPDRVAQVVTDRLAIPTIGIGAGVATNGQVLVFHDCLGLSERLPKFAQPFADGRHVLAEGLQAYRKAVLDQTFPDSEHAYHLSDKVWERVLHHYDSRANAWPPSDPTPDET
jgi:3-methyl-2-oxobutanoate hydroxymethyltransferase